MVPTAAGQHEKSIFYAIIRNSNTSTRGKYDVTLCEYYGPCRPDGLYSKDCEKTVKLLALSHQHIYSAKSEKTKKTQFHWPNISVHLSLTGVLETGPQAGTAVAVKTKTFGWT